MSSQTHAADARVGKYGEFKRESYQNDAVMRRVAVADHKGCKGVSTDCNCFENI
jgi:hypothetical protein